MSIFEFVTVAISIVLGLGVAGLLSSALDLFRREKFLSEGRAGVGAFALFLYAALQLGVLTYTVVPRFAA